MKSAVDITTMEVFMFTVIVSNEGQFPKPSDEDHASFLGIGPMCRYASDLLPTLKVVADKNVSKLKLDKIVSVWFL